LTHATFLKLDPFPSSGEVRDQTQLGPLKGASLYQRAPKFLRSIFFYYQISPAGDNKRSSRENYLFTSNSSSRTRSTNKIAIHNVVNTY
jgi:hypothetical protein